MRHLGILSLVFVFLLLSTSDLDAQRKKKKRPSKDKDRTEDINRTNFKDNLIYEIGFGNPTFFSGGGGSQFNMALKPGVGYKFTNSLAAGVFVKADLVFVNFGGQEATYIDYATGIFSKFKIIDALYIRGEFAYQSYENYSNLPNYPILTGRFKKAEPLLGLGYRQGQGNWTFNLELLFHMDREIRDRVQVYEFWLQAGYNF